jgi:hypothetical protein
VLYITKRASAANFTDAKSSPLGASISSAIFPAAVAVLD